ncbi:hypothetical protein CgunFtcFv8_005799 [Champsocephalus gunnari]|uniref:Uncharacterized protein n=1 Tax=Champsocephalus gunnari TaxID=52237 RepID=A0AAN8D164_CHAGU|nr:hypothetical protein CgunFtcFv8_005799 [Champsocephalus gunnari]
MSEPAENGSPGWKDEAIQNEPAENGSPGWKDEAIQNGNIILLSAASPLNLTLYPPAYDVVENMNCCINSVSL